MPMLTVIEIETLLQATLPTEYHGALPSFASLLAGIANGETSFSQMSDEAIVTAISILEALVGQSFLIGQTRLQFEPKNRITITGNAPGAIPENSPINVGDIANSHTVAIGHGATAITIYLPVGEKKPEKVFDLSEDDNNLHRFYR